jgi:hypothetical protein
MGFSDTLDIMRPMAISAHGRILDEPFLKKGLSVDALHVLLVRHLAVDVILDDHCHVLVAGGASLRDVFAVDSRLGVHESADVVLAVAVPTLGHFPDSSFEVGTSVDAVRVGKRV